MLSAVSMVGIHIQNQDAVKIEIAKKISSGYGYVVEKAEAHGIGGASVMPWRTN